MPDVIGAFVGPEAPESRRHQRADLIERARSCGPEERFQFREGLLNRVEVRAVGREESDEGADRFDRRDDGRLFVHRQIIEHHHVPGSQRGHQDLFDIREERRLIDRSVEHGGCAETLEPQRGDHRVCLPMAARRMVVEPDAARTPAIAPQQIRRDAALVEPHVLPHIAQRLPQAPVPPRRGDISAALLVGVYRFF